MTSQVSAPTAVQPPLPRGGMPAGVSKQRWWAEPDGSIVRHDIEMPVDQNTMKIVGELWMCLFNTATETCDISDWVFAEDPETPPNPRYCPNHGGPLQHVPLEPRDAGVANPVKTARMRALHALRARLDNAKNNATQSAQRRATVMRAAAEEAARRKHSDLKNHLPSAGGAVATLVGATFLVSLDRPLANAALGAALATAGAVVAYLVVYVLQRRAVLAAQAAAGGNVSPRQAERVWRTVRRNARRAATAATAAGAWLATAAGVAATVGADMFNPLVLMWILFGTVLIWVTCHDHWAELSQCRDSQREAARLAAEAAARRAQEEADRLAREAAERAKQQTPVVVEVPKVEDRIEAGRRMAAEWERISGLGTMPHGLRDVIKRTRIDVERTRELTVPSGPGGLTHIGWEYVIQAEPGVLVAGGSGSSLSRAKEWLSSVLEPAAPNLDVVDRPNNDLNLALLLVTDVAPLGGIVQWKGRAGIRIGSDGTIYGHVGRALTGEDVEKTLWTPGQAGGGSRLGVTGSGKSVGTQLAILNDLAGGILPILHDRKNLIDFVDFLGVIPMGCTTEHRDVIFYSLATEMLRRTRYLGGLTQTDRHGRLRRVEGLWVPDRDGPPIRGIWEEFHLTAKDEEFVSDLESLIRLQRLTAIMQELATQGGGLIDMGSSELRDQVNMICMQIYRMSERSAGLGGYDGPYSSADLPPLPGAQLLVTQGAYPIAMRGAYVHRKIDEDGSIFDQLFAPDMTPLLAAPVLPEATIEVFQRCGLMDLWELGKGPDGYDKLTSDTAPIAGFSPRERSTDSVTEQAAPAGKFKVEDVILAIIHNNPGCERADIDTNDLWYVASDRPASTGHITKVLKALDETGLLVRPDSKYTVTEAGRARAADTAAKLARRAAPVATDEPTPAQIERAALQRDELISELEREAERAAEPTTPTTTA